MYFDVLIGLPYSSHFFPIFENLVFCKIFIYKRTIDDMKNK